MTAIVTKKSVKYVQEKMHNITFNLVVSDGGVEVINKDFSCQYQPGETPAQKVAAITKEMQIIIEQYKQEKNIFSSIQLDNAVNAIQTGLVL